MNYDLMLQQGFLLTLFGLLGVFSALTLFYFMVKLLILLFPAKEREQ